MSSEFSVHNFCHLSALQFYKSFCSNLEDIIWKPAGESAKSRITKSKSKKRWSYVIGHRASPCYRSTFLSFNPTALGMTRPLNILRGCSSWCDSSVPKSARNENLLFLCIVIFSWNGYLYCCIIVLMQGAALLRTDIIRGCLFRRKAAWNGK